MRVISTQGDVYGPSAGLAKGQSSLSAPSVAPGTQTGAALSQKMPIMQVASNMQNSVLDNPILWLGAIVAFFALWKMVEEKRGGHEAFREIKIGGTNIVKVGGLAFAFAIILKFLTRRYIIPGLSPLVAYVYGSQ